MKRMVLLITAAALTLTAAVFAGCGGQSSSAPETTAAQETTVASAVEEVKKEVNLSDLHAINYEGNDFAGAWRITEREGDTYEKFVYMFDGDSKAYLMMGTVGYCSNYQINPDIKQFAAQLAFGINGKYTYEFSEDKSSVTLTDVDTKSVTKLEKIMSFAYIPLPEKDAVIDDALVGAWADDSGGYLFFDNQGILYETQKGLSFTFYNYSAEDGKVKVKYYDPDEEHASYDYQLKDDKLTFNNYQYERVSASELP